MVNENEINDEVVKDDVVVDDVVVEDNPVVNDEKVDIVDNDTDDKGSIDFDPSAFTDIPVKKTENDTTQDDDEVKNDGLDWVTDDNDQEEKVENKEKPLVESETTVGDDAPKKVSEDAFKQVAEGLGLDAEQFETVEQLKEHLVSVEEENNKLRNSSGSNATNDAVQRLEALKNKEDEELVKLALEKDGFEGDKLDDAVDRYIDNGLIDIEAQKIRNTIDNAIVNEQNKITQSTVDADATQQQEHQESVRKLEEHIKKTDTMFGFKMAKDNDSLQDVQQGHTKYITSGKFMNDVFANEESLAEVAWFTRNKEVIIKAIANQSLQKGKKAILDDIREPEVVSPQRFRDPEGSNEFDPKKFSARK